MTRRYAELGGHGDPIQTRDTPPDARVDDDRDHDTDDRATAPSKRRRTTSPAADDLQWLSREFGCILEVPGCCACCPPPDPRTGNYRAEGCRVGSPAVRRLLAPDGALGALAAALLAPLRHKTHLFNDQYIVKPPSSAHARFSWHRDSQWCDEPDAAQHRDDDADNDDAAGTSKNENRAAGSTRDAPSYLSLWTALDDAHAANGAVRVLPYPRDGDGDTRSDPRCTLWTRRDWTRSRSIDGGTTTPPRKRPWRSRTSSSPTSARGASWRCRTKCYTVADRTRRA